MIRAAAIILNRTDAYAHAVSCGQLSMAAMHANHSGESFRRTVFRRFGFMNIPDGIDEELPFN